MTQTRKASVVFLYTSCIIHPVLLLNITHILGSYNAVCGNMVCNQSEIVDLSSFRNIPIFSYECLTCSCDLSCFKFKSCCPDYFFSLQQSCVDTVFLRFNHEHVYNRAVSMISHCPESADEETRDLCDINYDFEDQIQNVPVTSTKTSLTYRNLYCSKCHNETKVDILHWKIELNCAEFADFNFISSYSEIVDYAKQKKCNFIYSNDNIFIETNNCDDHQETTYDLIRTCNVSGTWKTFDADIEFACRLYDVRYHVFKNIFCHLCNPPITDRNVTSHCNSTGLWNQHSVDLEEACKHVRYSPLTFPFKNIFCYLCNTDNREKSDRSFVEGTFYVTENHNENEFVFYYRNLDLNYEKILQKIHFLTEKVEDRLSDVAIDIKTIKSHSKNDLNMTKIIQKYFAFTGKAPFCYNYSTNINPAYCDCTMDCYFKTAGCCADKYLQRSIDCTNPIYSDDKQSYLVFGNCEKSTGNLLNELCIKHNHEHLLSFLPVRVEKDQMLFHYVNLYCAFCNEKSEINETSQTKAPFSISLWELKIVCNMYVPGFYHVSFEAYADFVRRNNCTVTYFPDHSVTCEKTNFKQCNATGHWRNYDLDIELLCETVTMPSNTYYSSENNVYCQICNPEHTEAVIYSECNITGQIDYYNKLDEEYCSNMPAIEYLAPYKNIFCKRCNTEFSMYRYMNAEAAMGGPHHNIAFQSTKQPRLMLPSYRVIFAFSNYKKQKQKPMTQITKCNDSQILDHKHNRCRDILCYPGRMLADGKCLPLLINTNNLGYILYIGLKGVLETEVNHTVSFLTSVEDSLKNFLLNYLELSSIHFELFYAVSDIECSEEVSWKKGTEMSISVYQKIFIEQNVNRTFTEEQLVSLTNSNFSVSHKGVDYSFFIHRDTNSIHLPILVSKFGFTGKCLRKRVFPSYGTNLYVYSYVNNLLLCQQIELGADEVRFHERSLTLKIASNNEEVNQDEYILVESGRARMCFDRYNSFLYKVYSVHKSADPWQIIGMICSCISLICLFLTFLTYCIFPSLKTLPGKNNMCLVFAMFCAQLTFQFVIYGKTSNIGCVIVGMLIHYFWLATFGCLSVCSFHMYRVFTSKTGLALSNKSRFLWYILYSYGTPFIIVSLNVIITFSISEISSFGYGGSVCFLNHEISFIVTFISPIALVCCSNILFFIVTTIKIARSPKVQNDSQMQTNKIHLFVYAKLFAITGISWVFQIIDSFIPESVFSYIVTILNALQGLFIFISYICNKRVMNLYKNLRSSYKNYSKTRSSDRTMTSQAFSHVSGQSTTL